jgi:hypothetical protein
MIKITSACLRRDRKVFVAISKAQKKPSRADGEEGLLQVSLPLSRVGVFAKGRELDAVGV